MAQEVEANRTFRALSEPVRRMMLDLLAKRELSVGEVARRLEMTQPAVSQHLRTLREAGLVRTRRQGRLRFYSVDRRPFTQVHEWIHRFKPGWQGTLRPDRSDGRER
ncbi:MAG TPA: metalloregulator ArsR/SmtB family transcription factor [Actinomycetota bacterium]|nr:metalloregulator ArsR/SmtB family transcription factor [Actinomycetota bacterium]